MGIAADIGLDIITGSIITIPDIIYRAGSLALALANDVCDLPQV